MSLLVKKLHNYCQRHSSFCSSSSSNRGSKIPGKSSSSRTMTMFSLSVGVSLSECPSLFLLVTIHLSPSIIWWTRSSRTFFLRLQHHWRSSSRCSLIQWTHHDDQNYAGNRKQRILLSIFLHLWKPSSPVDSCSRRIIYQCSTVDLCTRWKSRQWSRSTLCWFFRIVSPTMTQHWTPAFSVIKLGFWSNKRCLFHRNELSRSSSLKDVCEWCALLE